MITTLSHWQTVLYITFYIRLLVCCVGQNVSADLCGLELTFRQACTSDQKDEVEFLDVNHCITTDEDFSFVTKDFAKPTAEGRQFINGKSHHSSQNSSQSYSEK